jgi:hypothetical protein
MPGALEALEVAGAELSRRMHLRGVFSSSCGALSFSFLCINEVTQVACFPVVLLVTRREKKKKDIFGDRELLHAIFFFNFLRALYFL